MATELHWVSGPWPGKLALAARPRGGDWLADEIADWQQSGVDTILSLLTSEEEHDLDIADEGREARQRGLEFFSFPIPDRQVPRLETRFSQVLEKVDRVLASGKNVVLHCRQGVGRTGLTAACLLVARGVAPNVATARLSDARGISVPETEEQRRWITRYAESLASVR